MKQKMALIMLAFSALFMGNLNVSATAVESVTEAEEKNAEFEFDFKKAHWGDTQQDIIAYEGEPDSEGDMTAVDSHYIVYNASVAGKEAILAYYFCDGGLWQARYIVTESHSNESLYIDDYQDIKKALTKKYGDPLFDHESWQDDSKKSYYADKKGDALCYGYLTYWTWYSLDRTDITMDMSADNYKISTVIDFQSKEISPGEADYSDDF